MTASLLGAALVASSAAAYSSGTTVAFCVGLGLELAAFAAAGYAIVQVTE